MGLLLAGGHRDPNIRALARAARHAGIPLFTALTAPGHVPAICSDPRTGRLWIDGHEITPEQEPDSAFAACGASPGAIRKPTHSAPADGGQEAAVPMAEVSEDPLQTAESAARAGRAGPVTAAFLRSDVFGPDRADAPAPARMAGPGNAGARPGTDDRARQDGFLAVLRGWLAGADGVRRFNHDPFGRSRSVNKLAALRAAVDLGLAVPETRSGNDAAALLGALADGPMVQKPFRGGNYCQPLTAGMIEDHLGQGRALPVVTAQARLIAPDLRVFRAGRRLLGFSIRSAALDYRTDCAARITPCPVPQDLHAPLIALTDAMGLDWCASDFKTCPDSRRPLYLETNANPMFEGFDRSCDGNLCRAMLSALGFSLPDPGPGVAVSDMTGSRAICPDAAAV